jgi:AraC family transcriptional regulator
MASTMEADLLSAALPVDQQHSRTCRTGTLESHVRAVRRVISVMHQRYREPLSLEEMSAIAISSPFHFNRVFRTVTGVPPLRFLAALRLQAAKELLLMTSHSVTAICFEVGFNSLGTFTAHFSQYVGTSPGRFRRLADSVEWQGAGQWLDMLLGSSPPAPRRSVHGRLRAAPNEGGGGLGIIGLFPTSMPRGHPAACAAARVGAAFAMDRVPAGWFHVFAVEITPTTDRRALLLGTCMRRGHAGPVLVDNEGESPFVDVEMRPPRETDPPLLVTLPLLMVQRVATAHAS